MGFVYEILPFIQPSGDAIIDTGKTARGRDIFIINETCVSNQSACIAGASNGANYNDGQLSFSWYETGEYVYPLSNTTSTARQNVGANVNNTFYSFKLKDGKFYSNSTVTDLPSDYYYDYVGTRSMWIFGAHRTAPPSYSNGKLHYYCHKYSDGGNIIELVPVRSNGYIGCFDTVSHTILTNANSTGDFVSPLPNGYTRVEYIESPSGYCYINTGIKGVGTGTTFECRYQIAEHSTWHAIYGTKNISMGAEHGWCSYTIKTANVPQYSLMYDTWSDVSGNVDLNMHTVRQESNLFYLDGQLLFTKPEVTFTCPNDDLYVFARKNGSYNELPMKGKMWYFKCWINGTCVLDCIPCKNSSNVAGFYDVIQNRFLPSDGSGQFTAGPVITV